MKKAYDYESDDFLAPSDFDDLEPDRIADDGLGEEADWPDGDLDDPTPIHPHSYLSDDPLHGSETATGWPDSDNYVPDSPSSVARPPRTGWDSMWKAAAAVGVLFLIGGVLVYASGLVSSPSVPVEKELIGTWDARGTYYTTLPWSSSTPVKIDGSLEIRFNEAQALTVNVRPERVEVVGGPTITVPDMFPEFKGAWSIDNGRLAFRIDESNVHLDFLIAALETGYGVQVMNQRFELEIQSFDGRTLALEKGIVLERF